MAAWTVAVALPAIVLCALTLGLARRAVIRPIARAWALPLIALSGVRLDVRGAEHLRGRAGRVITFNHNSYADAFFIAAIAPPHFVPLVKREFQWVPVLGLGFWAIGCRFVRRGSSKAALRAVTEVAEWLQSQRYSAFVAPEGTRSKTGELGPFKRGAILMAQRSGVPLVPVVIHDARRIMRPGDWRVGRGVIRIDIHPPRYLAPDSDTKAETRRLRDDYLRWIQPTSDSSRA